MSPLDADQISSFKQHGYLILPGLVGEDVVQAWRDQFWGHVGAAADDASSWPEAYVVESFGVDPPFGQLPQIAEIIRYSVR